MFAETKCLTSRPIFGILLANETSNKENDYEEMGLPHVRLHL